MPATLVVGGKGATAVYKEWDGPNGTGIEVKPLSPVVYSSDDPTIATVDPTTGAVTAIAVGTTNINGVDPSSGLKASDVVTVTAVPPPPKPVSATLTLTAN
jgi:hypothetical protein